MQTSGSPQMFSLDFSDTMRHHPSQEAGANGGFGATPGSQGTTSDSAAMEAMAAALQLYDLCHPAEDCTISAVDLSKVLHSHLGGEAEVKRFLGLLSEGATHTPKRFDFLSYWQGMDRFLEASGAFHQSSPQGVQKQLDTIEGMQRFRDGVLATVRSGNLLNDGTISGLHLVTLLKEIQAAASDPTYWEEVMQNVPAEEGFGLTAVEVNEAVYIWLTDVLKLELDGGAGTDPEGMSSPQVPMSPGVCESSESPTPAGDAHSPLANRESLTQLLRPDRHDRRTDTSASFDYQRSAEKFDREATRPKLSLLEGLGPDIAAEVRRAHELVDLITERTPEDNKKVRRATAHLAVVHESVFKALWERIQEIDQLKREAAANLERKENLEFELERTVKYAGELDGRFADLAHQRDESVKKVTGLEDQVQSLTQQCEHLEHTLSKTKAIHEDHDKEAATCAKQKLRIEASVADLQRQADSAEGRAEWMRTKLKRMKTRMTVASRSLNSFADYAEECGEVSAILQQQLIEGASRTGSTILNAAPNEESERQVKLHQVQLQRLRQVRDELLKAHDGWATRTPENESGSPRDLQVHRRCTFLAAQVQALLQHTTELESLLDGERGAGDVEEKRIKSVQRIADQSQKSFDEFAEKLHTLEVQKADVDQELRRLQQRFAEQESQMRAVQRHRDQLLVESGSPPGARAEKRQNSDAGSSCSGVPAGGFLWEATPASGDLRTSPKATGKSTANMMALRQGVQTMLQTRRLVSAVGSEEAKERTSASIERPRPNPLGFSISARNSTQLSTGQWKRSPVERQRSTTRNKEDKHSRREHKDRDGHHQRHKDNENGRHKHKKNKEDGTCETQ